MEHEQYPAQHPELPGQEVPWQSGGYPAGPLAVRQMQAPGMAGRPGTPSSGSQGGFGEPRPPGAISDPCCMGSESAAMLGVLTGFAEEEAADRRQYQALIRQAPSWARQRLRELAADCGNHVRTLESICYLITGQCYHPLPLSGPVLTPRWCQALRERYHASACSALNYARAAVGTADPCLRRILLQLSREAYHQADVLMDLLEQTL